MALLFRDRANFKPRTVPATTAVASFNEEGTAVIYRGRLDRTPRLCLGDLQRCTMHNLYVMMHSLAMLRTDPAQPLHVYPR